MTGTFLNECSCFLFLVCLHPMTQVGSIRMCLDPDVVPPLAGFLLLAVLGVLHHILSVVSVCIFKLLTVFDLFISPGITFQASTTLFEKKFLLVSSLGACGLKFKGSAALLFLLYINSLLTIILHLCVFLSTIFFNLHRAHN